MAGFAQSARCRWTLLLEHFDEAEAFDRGGTCDNCVEPPEQRLAPPVDRTPNGHLPAPTGGAPARS